MHMYMYQFNGYVMLTQNTEKMKMQYIFLENTVVGSYTTPFRSVIKKRLQTKEK